jgi:hypothetical protein
MGGSTKNGELQQTVDEILDSFLLKVKALKTGLSTQKPLPAASNVSYDLFCWYSDPDQGGLTINLLLLSYI